MTTTNTSEPLSAQDVCAIIKQCKESNVSDIEWGGLKLSFGQSAITPIPQYAPLDPNLVDAPAMKTQLDEEEKLDLMLLEDPAAFEDYIAKKETETDEVQREAS